VTGRVRRAVRRTVAFGRVRLIQSDAEAVVSNSRLSLNCSRISILKNRVVGQRCSNRRFERILAGWEVLRRPQDRQVMVCVEVGLRCSELALLASIDDRFAESFSEPGLPVCPCILVGEVSDEKSRRAYLNP
jgi:hypothetical protein